MFLKFKHLRIIEDTFEDYKGSWTCYWETHFYKFKASHLGFGFMAMPQL